MKPEFVCGAVKSDLTNTEVTEFKSSKIPEVYFVPWRDTYEVINQGDRGICVSVSITDVILFLQHYKKAKQIYSRDILYNKRKNKNVDGMSIREGFEIAKNEKLISKYARLVNIDSIKMCIATQSPVVICLPVCNYEKNFWDGSNKIIGFHAVPLTGYTKRGFQIKNSWGTGYGDKGYSELPYKDFSKVIEAWCAFM